MTPTQQDMRRQAEAHYEAQRWAEAEPLFDTLSRELEPDGNLLHDRAVCLFQLGPEDRILDLLDRAAALEPDNPYRYSSRAWIRAAMKDVDGAIEDYRKALELDPDDAITLNNLGLLEEQYGMRKVAQERFKRADTLMGILKDAGVDPPMQRAKPVDPPSPAETTTETESTEPAGTVPVGRNQGRVHPPRNDGRNSCKFLKKGLRP